MIATMHSTESIPCSYVINNIKCHRVGDRHAASSGFTVRPFNNLMLEPSLGKHIQKYRKVEANTCCISAQLGENCMI